MTYFDKKGLEAKKKAIEQMQKELEFEESTVKEQEREIQKIIYKESPAVISLNIVILIIAIASLVLSAITLFWIGKI